MKQSLLKGATIASLGIIITKILGVLYTIPFAAMVGEEGTQLYSFGYNVYILFIDLSVAGLPFGVAKLISHYHSLNKFNTINKIYTISKRMMLCISIILFIAMFALAEPLASLAIKDVKDLTFTIKEVAFGIRMVSFALLFVPIMSNSRGFLQGFEEMTSTAKSQVIEQVARIIFLLGGVYLSLYVFKFELKIAVYFALLAALVGAIFGYMFVNKKGKEQIKYVQANLDKDDSKPQTTIKLVKKLIVYSIPFTLLALMIQFHNQINLYTILNTLEGIGYSEENARSVFNAITMWVPKLNRIVFSFTVGLTMSMIPSISANFAKGEYDIVKDKSEKSMQLILLITCFVAIFLSIFSEEVFRFFFPSNVFGPKIYRIGVISTIFYSLLYVTSIILQASNKSYTSILTLFVGVLVKLAINIPIVHYFAKLGIEAGYGFIVSTIIGFTVSIIINIIIINNYLKLNMKVLASRMVKLLIILGVTFGLTLALKYVVPYSPTSRLEIIIYLGLFGVFSLIIYLALGWYSKIIQRVLGNDAWIQFRRRVLKK